ncbi:MAG: T9SS type A sorting domain-containing protein [Candidatus Kapaibacterium sp.]
MKRLTYFSRGFVLTIISLCLIPASMVRGCPPILNCPEGVKYPYQICPYSTETDGRARIICAEDPYQIEGLEWPFTLLKAELPICILPYAIPTLEQIPYGNTVFDAAKTLEDFNRASYEWNCICGKQDDNCSHGCTITTYFSDNESNFDIGVLAKANTSYMTYFCELNCTNSYIMINNTQKFKGAITGPTTQFFINEDHITSESIDLIYSSGYKVFSLYETILHELGHVLGFDHPNESGCLPSYESVMNSHSNPTREKSNKPNLYDKCMFRKLYCPEISSVDDLASGDSRTVVYPNPTGSNVVIEFYVESEQERITIELYNSLGVKVIDILSNEFMNQGYHKLDIATENLTSGKYFYKINIGSKLEIKPVLIIK